MNAVIETQGLTRRFRKTVAVNDLSLEVPAGSIFALLGPNGAGKTTLIKMVMNMVRPSGGRATILGTDSLRLGPPQLERIGYVSENQELPEWMTVQELIDYCRPFYPAWDDDLCRRLIRQFNLPLARQLKTFSRGMKVKAALLSSLSYRPELMILDEPFTGLDALVRDELIRGLLEVTGQEERTIFIASHDIDEVERLADWVGVIHNGEMQMSEPAASLRNRFRRCEATLERGQEIPETLPETWLMAERAGQVLRFVDSRFQNGTGAETIREVLPGVKDLDVSPMSLKEIFLALARSWRLYEEEG
ncbi:MAG: ABC transporter ATP-binding protein [Acidobacteriota bacterium]|nr:ABC transporter ATP-binding protein [Acidobacteriota bacterium]